MNAIFLDRDGTINVELGEGKIDAPDKMVLLPHSLQALEQLTQLDYGIFLITNQLGIATGSYDEARFHEINDVLLKMIAPTEIKILKTYFCPHAPEDNCNCRKPKPGMLLQAADEFGVDLHGSWMVGDRLTDIGAGRAAGTKTILLRSGLKVVESPEADYTADDLLSAVRYIAGR